eukprot:TRINITY_DN5249_c0_g1_i2.p1 TRINITY_DN5249_c0_g1~~TRINITY_DN5249_c0_g1_i2.p1  ORF type:complete len:102 (-),score=13.34 TRINITY_DN5249_c0_g1_i2:236-541(-)
MGLARKVGRGGVVSTFYESMAWRQLPPEVLIDRIATQKSDIFSLAITMWKIGHSNKDAYSPIKNWKELTKRISAWPGWWRCTCTSYFQKRFSRTVKALIVK